MAEQPNKDTLSSLLSDPAALSSIAKLISSMSAQPPASAGGENAAGDGTGSDGINDGNGGIGGINGGNGGIGGINGGNGGIGGINGGNGGIGGINGGNGGIGGINGGNGGAGGTPDLSGVLSALSNPALMSSIASMAPLLSSMMSGGSAKASGEEARPLGLGGGAYPRPVYPTDRRSALLLALKPYMPEDKQSAIDTVVRVIEIMSAIK